MSFGSDMYQSIGVRPVINAKGVFTMLSGSLMLPECRQAMQQASRNFVQIDELMEAVGKRLAELTGAESAIVTCGCAAALAHATAACLAGGDPEKIHRLPNPDGLKSEVIVPSYSRNIYDQSVRMVGPKIISVANEEEMRMAINDRTAMAMLVGSPRDRGPLGLKEVAAIAHEHDVPVLLDAAAEALTIPNVHLERGADLVAYSGGKALSGPQSSGLLIGRKDLIQAAWLNSAPHHAFGRPMKVGKEDIMGAARRRRNVGCAATMTPSGRPGRVGSTRLLRKSRTFPESRPKSSSPAGSRTVLLDWRSAGTAGKWGSPAMNSTKNSTPATHGSCWQGARATAATLPTVPPP